MCEVSAFVADVLNSVLLPSGTYSPGKTSPQVLHFIISIGILVIHLLVLHILFYILFYIRCCFYICLTCLKINDVEPKRQDYDLFPGTLLFSFLCAWRTWSSSSVSLRAVNPHTLQVACFELSDTNFSYRRLSLSLLSLVSLFDNFFVLITGISSSTRLSIHRRHTSLREETQ
jgi:hypothetical protein